MRGHTAFGLTSTMDDGFKDAHHRWDMLHARTPASPIERNDVNWWIPLEVAMVQGGRHSIAAPCTTIGGYHDLATQGQGDTIKCASR